MLFFCRICYISRHGVYIIWWKWWKCIFHEETGKASYNSVRHNNVSESTWTTQIDSLDNKFWLYSCSQSLNLSMSSCNLPTHSLRRQYNLERVPFSSNRKGIHNTRTIKWRALTNSSTLFSSFTLILPENLFAAFAIQRQLCRHAIYARSNNIDTYCCEWICCLYDAIKSYYQLNIIDFSDTSQHLLFFPEQGFPNKSSIIKVIKEKNTRLLLFLSLSLITLVLWFLSDTYTSICMYVVHRYEFIVCYFFSALYSKQAQEQFNGIPPIYISYFWQWNCTLCGWILRFYFNIAFIRKTTLLALIRKPTNMHTRKCMPSMKIQCTLLIILKNRWYLLHNNFHDYYFHSFSSRCQSLMLSTIFDFS